MKSIFAFTILSLFLTGKTCAQCWQQVAAGFSHTTAIKSDSSLWTWGWNGGGQLGIGNFTDQYTPVQIGTEHSWKMVTVGGYHTLAVKNDGTLWAWGANYWGELGDGTIDDRIDPEQVGQDNDWKAVAAGGAHTVAIKTNGSLWAWGWNDYGQVGNGMVFTEQMVPVQIGTATNWDQVAAGYVNSLAIKTDGTLWAWGANNYGQLGIGTNTYYYSVPVQVGTATDWQQVTAGSEYTLAIKSDGTLWTWGQNHNGQLGIGSYEEPNAPQQIGTDHDWQQVGAKYYHTIAVKSNGTLWAWGRNTDGQLGDGTNIKHNAPVQVGLLTNWQQVIAGFAYTVAITNDGSLWSWGNNEHGQLGDGTDSTKITPVEVSCPVTTTQSPFSSRGNYDLSPNPARGYLRIQTTGLNTTDLHFEISNVLGKIVYTRQSPPDNQEIDIDELAAGLYFLIITNKNDRTIKPFVKM